jgi:hypothetical protein
MLTRHRELHDIIADALEFGIFDHGDAIAVVTTAFAAVVDILLKHPRFAGVSRFEIELLLRDTQFAAENAISSYSLADPQLDANTIVDWLLDEAEPAA